MITADAYQGLLLTWLGLAAATFLALFFIAAPYGRHNRKGFGPSINNRLGWILMEAPTLIVFDLFLFKSSGPLGLGALALAALWHLHYINRTLVYPLRQRGAKSQQMPAFIALMGMAFNTGNATLQAAWLFHLAPAQYTSAWLLDPRFLLGAAVFLTGFVINLRADATLRNLRAPGETGYKIPTGHLYAYVSCPNYFGELVEWTGWALATYSLGGLTFAVWTAANLVPRAITHHRWYRQRFPQYPKSRRAILPFVL